MVTLSRLGPQGPGERMLPAMIYQSLSCHYLTRALSHQPGMSCRLLTFTRSSKPCNLKTAQQAGDAGRRRRQVRFGGSLQENNN